MEYDCYEKSAKINDVEMNLNPSADEVKKDIEELIGLFNNFDQFVSRDVNKLKGCIIFKIRISINREALFM